MRLINTANRCIPPEIEAASPFRWCSSYLFFVTRIAKRVLDAAAFVKV